MASSLGPSPELLAELSFVHEEWQSVARREVHFLTGSISRHVGKALTYEEVQPASLVVGGGSGKQKCCRSTAAKWCVRGPQEAAKGWVPSEEMVVQVDGEVGPVGQGRYDALNARGSLNMCGNDGRVRNFWRPGLLRPWNFWPTT